MRILIIGATRGIGREAVKEALRRGHEVRAFSRSARDMAPADRLEPFAGDATRAEDVAAALEGMEAVILAIGVPKSPGFVINRVRLFSKATEVLCKTMPVAGVSRLVAVTGFGAGSSRRALGPFLELPFRAVFGRAYDDKDRQEHIIEECGLDWTIFRPGLLTSGPASGRARALVEPESWHAGLVSRADVARYCVEAVETGAWMHQAPVLVR